MPSTSVGPWRHSPAGSARATVLRYYLDLSVLEVAAALGIGEGTAKTTLFRARQALAETLGFGGAGLPEEVNDVARS